MNDDEAAREHFVREHTVLARPPLVPELVVTTATDVTPLWHATEAWLGRSGLAIPFWSVPWAGGQALARWVLDHPESVRDARVVDLGCGGGVVALAAARAGAARVLAVDVDPFALTATRIAAEENGLATKLTLLCEDVTGRALEDVDVLLAGDVWYEEAPARRFTTWMAALRQRGVRVVTGDPGRSYVPADLREVARYEVPTPWELESAPSRTARILV